MGRRNSTGTTHGSPGVPRIVADCAAHDREVATLLAAMGSRPGCRNRRRLSGIRIVDASGEGIKAAPTITPTTTAAPKAAQADQVAAEVQSSMQSKLDTDPDLSPLHLKVVHVDLVNKAGNEYKGIATVKTSRGTSHDVPIDVTSDGDKTLWEAAPGAFLFAVQDMPTPTPPVAPPPPAPRPAPPVPAPSTVENFRICPPSGLTGVATDETSCAFADSVRAAWYSQPGTTVLAYSPVTHQSYLMTCIESATNVWRGSKRCSGVNAQGTVLIVYID